MSVQIRLSELLFEEAKVFGRAEGREPNQQIEYWAKVGKLAITNPDLPYVALRDILVGIEQYKAGDVIEMELDDLTRVKDEEN